MSPRWSLKFSHFSTEKHRHWQWLFISSWGCLDGCFMRNLEGSFLKCLILRQLGEKELILHTLRLGFHSNQVCFIKNWTSLAKMLHNYYIKYLIFPNTSGAQLINLCLVSSSHMKMARLNPVWFWVRATRREEKITWKMPPSVNVYSNTQRDDVKESRFCRSLVRDSYLYFFR